ncbi:hypothetical protein DM860_015074 [Cuscuta australis]|uniref:Uncharacterized protein n=1 Tax=Cuscuta australis TaxID=267555 RepID=A0A328DY70_9ASTE|nr:hypothetical protein DM860_015074 [Cuscuta australis]
MTKTRRRALFAPATLFTLLAMLKVCIIIGAIKTTVQIRDHQTFNDRKINRERSRNYRFFFPRKPSRRPWPEILSSSPLLRQSQAEQREEIPQPFTPQNPPCKAIEERRKQGFNTLNSGKSEIPSQNRRKSNEILRNSD